MANVILVDDHEIIMDSLRYLIEEESQHKITGKFISSELVLTFLKAEAKNTDLAIIDVKLPDINGVDLTRIITDNYPHIKVILLSQYSNQEFVLSSLRNGALGYVLKSTDGQELIKAITTVLDGKQYLCDEATKVLVQANQGENINLQLTVREKDILSLIARGMTSKEMAQVLSIKESTVDFHKKNLKTKLNVNKISDLTKWAIELGLIDTNSI